MTKEIEIPEGYEAKIEDNKVIFVQKESEDEKIRKELLKEIEFIIPRDGEKEIADKWDGHTPQEAAERLYKYLQQEQSEPSNNLVDIDAVREDFITEVYRVLDADPTNDRANAIIYAFDSLPTVSQEQPEMDLNEEIYFWLEGGGLIYPMSNKEENNIKDTAIHFFKLGLNSRK